MSTTMWWCGFIFTAYAAADSVTWPRCTTRPNRVVQPGTPDNEASILNLKECGINNIQSENLVYPNLETLILSSNYIENLNADVFKSLPQLRSLYLGYNKVRGEDIHSSVFKNCRRLERIGFTGLNMTGASEKLLDGLDSLQALWLDGCYLETVPVYVAHPSLTQLNLYNNKIRTLDAVEFKELKSLERLHLYNNLIELIHNDTFRYLTKLVSIHLNRNKIRYLPDDLFANLTSLETVNLENNVIEYISANLFGGCKNLTNINLANNKLTFLPENFIGEFGSLKSFYFDRNPWQCGCLNDILIEVKEKAVKYVDKYYQGSLQVCVSLDFRCHRLKDVFRELYEAITQSRG